MIKKIATVAASCGLLLVTAVPAFAHDTCKNENTGALSYNKCKIYLKKKAYVNVSNSAAITQSVTTNENTGNNQSNFNIWGGGVLTGKAKVEVELDVKVNKTEVDVDQSSSDGSYRGVNSWTGVDSDNLVIIKDKRKVDVTVNNSAVVTQVVNSTVNTGGNESSFNTDGGYIDTGNAKVEVEAEVHANSTQIAVSQ